MDKNELLRKLNTTIIRESLTISERRLRNDFLGMAEYHTGNRICVR